MRYVDVHDWDKFVKQVYKRPYNFQQQQGCQSRGTRMLEVPPTYNDDSEMNDTIPEEVNGAQMGVKFAVWLARDPKQPMANQNSDFHLELFWDRNFYPCIEAVAQDLYNRGLLEPGEYCINIDW